MSMIGNFKRVSPRLMTALIGEPSMVRAVIEFGGDSIETGAGPFSIPSNVKKTMDALPEDQRDAFYKSLSDEWEKMMSDPRAALIAGASQDRKAGGRSALENAGFTEEDMAPDISIEKAWHGLHFLLCGGFDPDLSPLGRAILGGTEIGDDMGYGPARYLSAEEVKTVAAALNGLTDDELKSRYNADEMSKLKLYPGGWDDLENIEWLLAAARDVRQYYRDAADRGFAMLLYLT